MAEDLTEYLHENGIKVRYMHSDIDTLERIEIMSCLLYTSDAADDLTRVDLGGRRIIKKI